MNLKQKTSNPLKNLKSKKILAALLGFSLEDLRKIRKSTSQLFHEFEILQGSKKRRVQHPIGHLEKIHEKILFFLRSMTLPDYVFSGKKGVSYIDNASFHKNNKFVNTADIESFYPNCKSENVIWFFEEILNTSNDVAKFLADLLLFEDESGNKFIPTGSPVSQVLAFWSHCETFKRIYELSFSLGIQFSIYVDDITFSSNEKIPFWLMGRVAEILRGSGLKIKRKKLRKYFSQDVKVITGCAVSNGTISSPFKLRQKIHSVLEDQSNVYRLREKVALSLLGRVRAHRQIEKDAYPVLYKNLVSIEIRRNRRLNSKRKALPKSKE